MDANGNVYAALPSTLAEEEFLTLLSSPAVRIERIVSRGQASAPDFWYDQPWAEWVLVLKGAALLRFEGEADPVRLEEGSYVAIPPGRRHRVEWTDPAGPTIWLAIHHGG
jgi:cupin 2 domain-containing protein